MSLSDEDRLSLLARIADLREECAYLRRQRDQFVDRILNPLIYSAAPPLLVQKCPRCGFPDGGQQHPMDFTQGDPS